MIRLSDKSKPCDMLEIKLISLNFMSKEPLLETKGKEKISDLNPNISDIHHNIGIVKLKSKLEGIELKCDIDITLTEATRDEVKTTSQIKKISQVQMLFYFYLPFLVLVIATTIDYIYDYYFHLLLFILPVVFGFIIHSMVVKSGTIDPNYFKKFVDTITFASSGLTACILIFKTIDISNPYTAKIYQLINGTALEKFLFILIFSVIYTIITIFAISAVLKFLISLSDLRSYKAQ